MKIAEVRSHFNGLEFLMVHHKSFWAEINDVIARTNTLKSKELISLQSRKASSVTLSQKMDAFNDQKRTANNRVSMEIQNSDAKFELSAFVAKNLALYNKYEIDVGIAIVRKDLLAHKKFTSGDYKTRGALKTIGKRINVPVVPLVLIVVDSERPKS